MRAINIITLLLVIVGGLNWLLVGIADFDLVAALFGADTTLTNLVYIVVGISALWQLIPLARSFSAGETAAEANLRH
jgi:uncharacterized protein